jgi:TPR repeat protein
MSYAHGDGVPQDYEESVHWFQKAAGHGDATGQYSLGFSYARGQGVAQSYSEAAHWYRKAAEQGDRNAQYALGNLHRKGQGLTKDYNEARRWYEKAAKQGDMNSKYALDYMDRAGERVLLPDWSTIFVVVGAIVILTIPRRFWGSATWLPLILCSTICALQLFHEWQASLWTGSARELLIGLLGGASAICAFSGALVTVRALRRR